MPDLLDILSSVLTQAQLVSRNVRFAKALYRAPEELHSLQVGIPNLPWTLTPTDSVTGADGFLLHHLARNEQCHVHDPPEIDHSGDYAGEMGVSRIERCRDQVDQTGRWICPLTPDDVGQESLKGGQIKGRFERDSRDLCGSHDLVYKARVVPFLSLSLSRPTNQRIDPL